MRIFRASIRQQAFTPISSFSVFHGTRDGELMSSRFRLWQTSYKVATQRWTDKEHDLSQNHSCLAHLDGTGKNVIEKRRNDWVQTSAKSTSRAAIWAFCDALGSGEDQFSGGAPQLVGLWRKEPAQNFGFLWNGRRYLSGLEVARNSSWDAVHWFNHLFERCDGRTGNRLKSAQRHIKPES